MNFMGLSVGTAMAPTDWFVAVIDILGVKTDVRIPRSLITGASVATTKRRLKGDNTGNAIAEATQAIAGNVGTATISAGTNIVIISSVLTAPLQLVLPLLSGMSPADYVEIRDPGGFVGGGANVVSVIRQGGSDTINLGASAVTVLNRPRQTAFVTANNALTDWGTYLQFIPATGNLPAKLDGAGGITAIGIVAMGDANIALPVGTNTVLVTAAFTAPRTATFPVGNNYTVGDSIIFLDPNGFVGRVNCLNGIRNATDSINGLTSAVPLIYAPRGYCEVTLGAIGAWGTSGLVTPSDIQVFTSNGTWTRPIGNYRLTRVMVIGGGGGGGSGRKGAAASNRGGGGGGGSGGYTALDFNFADMASSVAVTVGAAGAGGTAQATNSTDGVVGTGGGFTTFGNYVACSGGFGGGAGTNAVGGAGGGGSPYGFFIGDSGAAGGFGVAGVAANAPSPTSSTWGSGGGGGGGISSANTAFNGGNGGSPRTAAGSTAATGGVAPGGAGAAALAPGTNSPVPGFGGAGGAGGSAGAGGAGSAGTNGSGGGGGGAGIDAVGNSGAGGAGGPGLVVVLCLP